MRGRAWRTTWLVVAILMIVVVGVLAWGFRSRLPGYHRFAGGEQAWIII